MTKASSHAEPAQRKGRKRWTAEDQARAEVAAACGVTLREIGRTFWTNHQTVRYRLMPDAAAAQRKRSRHQYAVDPEASRERNRRWRDLNFDASRDQQRSYREQNREAIRERKRSYREENIEACRERDRRRHAANPEIAREQVRRWRAANCEASREQVRRWQKANPDARREISRRRRALKRAAHRRALQPVTLAAIRERFALFGGCCAYCGTAENLTIDHVLALKYGGLDESANVAPACRRCNSSKHTAPGEQWYRRQPFFTEARWRKLARHCPAAVTGQPSLALGSGSRPVA